jgi:hypothetical protein
LCPFLTNAYFSKNENNLYGSLKDKMGNCLCLEEKEKKQDLKRDAKEDFKEDFKEDAKEDKKK